MKVKEWLKFYLCFPEAESETKTWVQFIWEAIPRSGHGQGVKGEVRIGPLHLTKVSLVGGRGEVSGGLICKHWAADQVGVEDWGRNYKHTHGRLRWEGTKRRWIRARWGLPSTTEPQSHMLPARSLGNGLVWHQIKQSSIYLFPNLR